jgi:hypothetical protein
MSDYISDILDTPCPLRLTHLDMFTVDVNPDFMKDEYSRIELGPIFEMFWERKPIRSGRKQGLHLDFNKNPFL